MLRPIRIDKQSPFLGEECALCKEPFAPGAELVICPEDGSRHHTHCWRANGNRCTAYGCTGTGDVSDRPVLVAPRRRPRARVINQIRQTEQAPLPQGRSKVRTMPSSNFGCAQTCLLLGIAVAIVFFALGCFGLWAIADYIMIEVLGYQYRAPFSGAALPLLDDTVHHAAALWLLLA